MKIWNPKKYYRMFQTWGKKTTPKRYQKFEFQTLNDTTSTPLYKTPPSGIKYLTYVDQVYSEPVTLCKGRPEHNQHTTFLTWHSKLFNDILFYFYCYVGRDF